MGWLSLGYILFLSKENKFFKKSACLYLSHFCNKNMVFCESTKLETWLVKIKKVSKLAFDCTKMSYIPT